MKEQKKRSAGAVIILLAALLGVIRSETLKAGASAGIKSCLTAVIPSLYFFLFLSTAAAYAGFPSRTVQKAGKFTFILFGLPGDALISVITSLTCGYPSAAKSAAALSDGTKNTEYTKRLLLFFTCPGIPFTVVFCGKTLFGSTKTGLLLYISCLTADLLCAVIFNRLFPLEYRAASVGKTTGNFSVASAVGAATDGIISVCGWIVLFSAVSEVLLSFVTNEKIAAAIRLVSEITVSAEECARSHSMTAAAFCLSFGGICIFFQLLPMMNETGVKPAGYLLARTACGITAAGIEKLLLAVFPQADTVNAVLTPKLSYSGTVTGSLSLILLSVIFIIKLNENGMRNNNMNN